MKKNLKKLVTGLMVSAMVLGLAGCSSSASGSENAGGAAPEQTTVAAPADGTDTGSAEGTADAEPVEVRHIVAATGGGPRPLVFTLDDGTITGHNTELLRAIFDRLPQYELEIVQVDGLSSIITGVNSGIYQIGFNNLARNEEREKLVCYTDPIMENEYLVVCRESIPVDPDKDLTQFAGLTYIGGAGNDKTTVIEDYNDEHPDQQINIEYGGGDIITMLQDVESGRYDISLIDAPMYFAYYSKEYPFNLQTYSLRGRTSTKYTYFVTGYDDEQLTADINAALAEIIADGTSKKICEEFLFSDFTPYPAN